MCACRGGALPAGAIKKCGTEKWLDERWVEKDAILAHYATTGRMPDDMAGLKGLDVVDAGALMGVVAGAVLLAGEGGPHHSIVIAGISPPPSPLQEEQGWSVCAAFALLGLSKRSLVFTKNCIAASRTQINACMVFVVLSFEGCFGSLRFRFYMGFLPGQGILLNLLFYFSFPCIF